MNECPDRRARGERGLALVLTLLVVVLLMTAVLEFDRSTRTAIKAAGNFRDGLRAFHLASSGVAAAQAILKDSERRTGGLDSLEEIWATPFPPYPVGGGTVALSAQDEARKFNVNSLVTQAGEKPRMEKERFEIEQLRELFRLTEVDPDLVDAIVDWLDIDDIPEPRGAEAAYYQGLDLPYACRNGPLETLSELHLIRGITDEVFQKISPYLTVYWNGNAEYALNVNTADPLVLASFHFRTNTGMEALGEESADKIAQTRPFETLNDLSLVEGMPQTLVSLNSGRLSITSRFFSITAEGEVSGVRKSVLAVADRNDDFKLTYWRLAD